jgi:indolepyruvate ferredoxin oxidoreductase alpha subunit
LDGLDEVLAVEDLDPVIEDELIRMCGLYNLNVKIRGKRTGDTQNVGENTPDIVAKAIGEFLGSGCQPLSCAADAAPPAAAPRRPQLCAGCSHRAAFSAVKEMTKDVKAVYTGDIGCYTLGNAMGMVDTCLCMGGGITVAQGLQRVEPESFHFAFIGDSTFFHSGITGVVNAVYNQTDIIVVILDNATTAMTGNQPHPGMGVTMMGETVPKIDIGKIVEACGVSALYRVNPFDAKAARQAVTGAMGQRGVRVILYEHPCIMYKAHTDAAANIKGGTKS